jgi:tape measure domain-containing protein
MSGVEIRVRSDSRQARQDLNRLEKSVTGIEKSANSLGKAFKNIAISGTLFYGISRINSALLSATDSFTNLENRIALVTGRGAQLGVTMRRLSQISASTRVGMNTTAETFNRFGLALSDTNVSANELLEVTRTINQAVKISGASAESARAAIIQFGQGLASGQLRGQELNSVLEQTPRIARAIADGIGIPFGQLRDAAADGKLTTDAVLRAIQQAAPEIRKEFTLIQRTVEDVSLQMRTQFRRAIRVLSDETGWADFVIAQMDRLTFAFKYFADFGSAYIRTIKNDFSLFALEIRTRSKGLISSFENILDSFSGLFSGDFNAQIAIDNFKSSWNKFTTEAKKIINFDFLTQDNKFDFTGFFNQFTIPKTFTESFKSIENTLKIFVENIKSIYDVLFGKTVKNTSQSSIIPISLTANEAQEQVGLFDQLLNTLTKWSGSVISLFLSVQEALSPISEFIAGMAKGTVEALENSKFSLDDIGTRLSAITGIMSTLTKTLDDVTGASSKIRSIQSLLLGDDTAETSRKIQEIAKEVDEKIFGKQTRVDGTGGRVGGLLEEGIEGIRDNPLLTTAAIGGIGIGLVFPETTLAALKIAGIGFGLAAVQLISKAFDKGLPFILLVAGIKLLPEADDKEAQERIRKIGENLAVGLKSLFSSENLKEGDVGSNLFENISQALSSLGEGILEGIFNTDFEKGVGTAIVGAITAGVFAALIGFGPAKTALSLIAGSIVGSIRGSEIWKGFSSSFVNELFGPASSYGPQSEKVGKGLAKGVKAGFSVLAVGELFDFSADKIIGEADTIQDKFGRALSKGALQGITAAAATGAGANPIVLFAAAIAGAITQSLYLVFTDPEIKSSIRELGAELYEGFKERFLGGKKDLTNDQALQIAADITTGGEINATAINAAKLLQNSQNPANREAGRQLRKTILDEKVATELKTSLDRLNSAIESGKSPLEVDAARFKYLLDFAKVIERAPIQEQGVLLEKFNQEISEFNNIEFMTQKLKREINALGRNIFIEIENGIGQAITTSSKITKFSGTRRISGLASGGYISGSGGPRDDKIPAMLSNGEYVINAASTAKHSALVKAINEDRLPKFANGGFVGTLENLSGYSDPKRLTGYLTGMLASNENTLETLVKGLPAVLTDKFNATKNNKRISNLFSGKADDDIYQIISNSAISALESAIIGIGLGQIPAIGPIMGAAAAATDVILQPLQGFVKFFRQTKQLDSSYGWINNFLDYFTEAKTLGDVKEQITTGPRNALKSVSNFISGLIPGYSAGGLVQPFEGLTRDLRKGLAKFGINLLERDIDPNTFGASFGAFGFESNNPKFEKEYLDQIDKMQNAKGIRGRLSESYNMGRFLASNANLSSAHINPRDDNFELALTKLGIHAHEVGHGVDYLSMLRANRESKLNTVLGKTIGLSKQESTMFGGAGDFVKMVGHRQDRLIGETFANNFSYPIIERYGKQFGEKEATKNVLNKQKILSQFGYILAHISNFRNEKFPSDYALDALNSAGIFSLSDWNSAFEKYPGYATSEGLPVDQNYLNIRQELINHSPFSNFKKYLENNNANINRETIINSVKDTVRSFISKGATKLPRFASGGYITGEGGPTDDKIPAMLSNKEFVVNAKSTSKFRPILEAINAGTYGMFAPGTPASNSSKPNKLTIAETAAVERLNKDIATAERFIETFNEDISSFGRIMFLSTEGSVEYNQALRDQLATVQQRTEMENLLKASNEELEYIYNKANTTITKTTKVVKGMTAEVQKLANAGNDAANRFKDSFNTSLQELFKTGDFGTFGDQLLDSFTSEVISSFSTGFTDMIFKDLIGTADKEGNVKTPKILDKIFGGQQELGETGKVSNNLQVSTKEFSNIFTRLPDLFGGIFNRLTGSLGGIFNNLSGSFGGLFNSLTTNLGGLFNGFTGSFSGIFNSALSGLGGIFNSIGGMLGGGGGGGIGSLLSIGMSFLGLSQGGIVPNTPYSQVGKDSVPTMLTPGELVIPADKVKSMDNKDKTSQAVYNINVSGDVSRQTRKEIVKMIPQITAGVNTTNKENNFRP